MLATVIGNTTQCGFIPTIITTTFIDDVLFLGPQLGLISSYLSVDASMIM